MQFETIALLSGATTPDPRVSPGLVPTNHILRVPSAIINTDTPPQTVVYALEGGTTASVEMWVLDEPSDVLGSSFEPPTQAQKLLREWYSYGDAVIVPEGEIHIPVVTEGSGAGTVVAKVPCPTGSVYFRITVAPAAAAVLKVGFLGS